MECLLPGPSLTGTMARVALALAVAPRFKILLLDLPWRFPQEGWVPSSAERLDWRKFFPGDVAALN